MSRFTPLALVIAIALGKVALATTFEKAVNPNFSYLQGIQQTLDGGYVFGGVVSDPPYVAFVGKLDSSGNFQWQKQYQYSGNSAALYTLKQTSDGGYIWGGYLQNSITYNEVGVIAKVDSNGDVQWHGTFSAAEYVTDIKQTSDGGYIAGGVTPEITGSNPYAYMMVDGWLAKLDSSGKLQWQRLLGASPNVNVMINAVTQTTDGGYAVAGLANSNVLAAKLDASGNVKWQTVYTSPSGLGLGYSIVQSSDGGYIVGGYDNDSPFLALALKLGSNGQVQWAKTYNISGAASKFFSVRQTSDGGYVFAGQFDTGLGYYYGYFGWMVKTDSAGNAQWQKAYGNPNYAASFEGVGLTSDGGFVAGGYTLEYNGQNQMYIVKTDSSGNLSNCSDVQVTAAVVASLKESASAAKLTVTAPAYKSGSGTVSASSTAFTLATSCSGN
jgi:PQQ-like domain